MPDNRDRRYFDHISTGLEAAFESAETRSLDLGTAKYIIFSDHHRGQRDGADDFLRCERAYNAALGYYLASGFTLVVLGDAEELWECRPSKVVDAYEYTLSLESQFHVDGQRYVRIAGNHDDLWSNAPSVERYLGKKFPGLQVHEAVRLGVVEGSHELGTMLLVHGHQGTLWSDRNRSMGRFLVRNFWRPIQRLTRAPSTTPARSFSLRRKHDLAMYEWASRKPNLLLIAGHTHRPILESKSLLDGLGEDLQSERLRVSDEGESPEVLERIARLQAKIEWVKAQDGEKPEETGLSQDLSRPCYFNTGCCSFGDGDVTGLELCDGEVRLVRWPDNADKPLPEYLRKISLTSVFEHL